MGGDLAEPPGMIAGIAPEVGANEKDGTAKSTCPILVRDEALAWRQKNGRSALVRVLRGQHRRTCVDTADSC